MKTLVRVVEYWVPTADRSLLELGGGHFGSANGFAAISSNLCFGKGEGLPGQAWETGRPVVLKALDGTYFRRAAAAKSAGLTRALAVPIFMGDAIRSVAVVFCSDDGEADGGMDPWSHTPAPSANGEPVDDASYVVQFLSALATPSGHRVEAWAPDALSGPDAPSLLQASTTGVPVVAEPLVAIPVAAQGSTRTVLALHF